jgi:hypothetical protein
VPRPLMVRDSLEVTTAAMAHASAPLESGRWRKQAVRSNGSSGTPHDRSVRKPASCAFHDREPESLHRVLRVGKDKPVAATHDLGQIGSPAEQAGPNSPQPSSLARTMMSCS